MNEKEVIEKIKWSIQINNATKEINGDNTSINVQVLETLLTLLEKKDKIIDLMADKLVQDTEWFYSEFDNYTKEDFRHYFERRVENGN